MQVALKNRSRQLADIPARSNAQSTMSERLVIEGDYGHGQQSDRRHGEPAIVGLVEAHAFSGVLTSGNWVAENDWSSGAVV